MPRSPRLLAPLALAVLSFLTAPGPAAACMNGVERRVDPTTQRIREAEALLADGKYKAAVREVLEAFPTALRADYRDHRLSLFDRGQRVIALAVVRSEGAVKLDAALPGKTAAEREAGLAWATMILRLHRARGNGGVLLTSELAEALALRPSERPAARLLLKELADGDIMPTARGWAILGVLERDHGDADAAARAVARCKEISPDAKQCDLVSNT